MKWTHRPKFTKALFLLCLAAGLFLLAYPGISNKVVSFLIRKESEDYDQYTYVDTDFYFEEAAAYNQALAASGSRLGDTKDEEAAEAASGYLNPLGTGIIGYIEIEKIDVYLPIYNNTGEESLQSGAGWWVGSSLPIGGESTHAIITAHNGLVKAKMFTDLDCLEIGDTFTLTVLGETLTYEVDQILVADPADYSALQIVEGQDYVTLYTCTPYLVNTERLLVRGVRTDAADTEEAAFRWKWILLISGICAASTALWIRHRRKVKLSGRTQEDNALQ